MPDTEQCPLGAENKTRINYLEGDIKEIKVDIKGIEVSMSKLANHYSKRPSWFISLVITGLVGLVIFLIKLRIAG